MAIAKTIMEQIKVIDRMAFMSWGSRKFAAGENYLQFQINTPKLSNGWVKITLNEGKDLYEIETFNSRKRFIEKVEDVFFEDLVFQIDNLIENKEYLVRVYN